jgi:hypothetical protein
MYVMKSVIPGWWCCRCLERRYRINRTKKGKKNYYIELKNFKMQTNKKENTIEDEQNTKNLTPRRLKSLWIGNKG